VLRTFIKDLFNITYRKHTISEFLIAGYRYKHD